MAVINKPSDINKIWAVGGDKVSPSDIKISTGWEVEVPPRQYFNWLDNKQDQFNAHVNQHGIVVWDNQTDYNASSKSYVMGSDGGIYKSVAASGPSTTVQDPTTDVADTYWEKAFTTQDVLDQRISETSSLVGSLNVRASVPTASSSAIFTADSLIVAESFSGLTYRLSAYNKTVNLAIVGVGGMDVGSAPVSGYVAVYAIYNPTTEVSALIAVNATAAKAPEVYGGASMPAGYTASALIAVLPTNGSGLFKPAFLNDRRVYPEGVAVLSTTTPQGSFVSLNVAAAVPKNAKTFNANLIISGTVNGARLECGLSGSDAVLQLGAQIVNSGNTLSGIGEKFTLQGIPLVTEQVVYYIDAPSSGGISGFIISATGYTF